MCLNPFSIAHRNLNGEVMLKEVTVIVKDINETQALLKSKLKLIADKTEVLIMGTPQMRANNCIPSITISRGVILPVCNEPEGNLGDVLIQTLICLHMYQRLSCLQYTNLETLEKQDNFSILIQQRVPLAHW